MSVTASQTAEWHPTAGAVAVDLESIIRAVQTRLPAVPPLEIEPVVVQEAQRFRDAHVVQFVPILVERAAVLRLRAQRPTSLEGNS